MLGTVDSMVAVATGIETLPAADALTRSEDEWALVWVSVVFVDALRDVFDAGMRSIGHAPKPSPALLRNGYAASEEIHNPQRRPTLGCERVNGQKAKEKKDKNPGLDNVAFAARS